MNFKDISSLNITTELEILKRDTQRYSSFLYQHKGLFSVDNTRIGNDDQEESITKFINVLTKAKEENISLVLSPEYSCPKSVIDEIIADKELQPSQQKIWALGGESLNKEELIYFRDLQNQEIHIHFEDCYSNSDKKFVDPLYYIFKGQHNGVDKLIILIQFKTWHMGVWSGELERNNLIQGDNVYIIKNNNTSTRLISFICSEAMNVREYLTQHVKDEFLWGDMPFLVLHPQINPDPSHQDFVSFRRFILETEKKELISLNWGINTYFNGVNWYSERGNTARSGIFFKTRELNFKKSHIEKSHNKGFYFLHIDINHNKYVDYLSGIPDLFHIENNAVDINIGATPQRRREGPTVSNIYNFNNTFDIIKINGDIPDNHIDFLTNRGVLNEYLLDPTKSVIDKEILLNISTGKVKAKEGNKWSDIINLNSFTLNEADECNNRLTYLEDTYVNSEFIRNNNCSNIIELDSKILTDNSLYPHSLKRFNYKDFNLAFSSDASNYNYRYNVVNENYEIQKATICYLGNASDREIKHTYDELQKLFEKDTIGIDTVVVFYKRGNSILDMSSPEAGDVTKTPTSHNSITE